MDTKAKILASALVGTAVGTLIGYACTQSDHKKAIKKLKQWIGFAGMNGNDISKSIARLEKMQQQTMNKYKELADNLEKKLKSS
ncbi:hypothetical protein COR50_14870 [Chitinophaga caeni]|uniref:Uncharacterized protein n=1 Tax=Chitinophaga caeni TaxID=2029983 RepID=A0A291QWV5_9BACT|nr:hypothetical protein [Chitinophaga caeni]ATL48343.1 hypothetical protein COR50_14870 [Chitinophaga caeni]